MIESFFQALVPGLLAALAAAAPHDSLARVVRPVRTLPTVMVDATRTRLDARRRMPTASVTELRANAPGRAVEDVAELLQQSVGTRVVQYGGLGAFSTLSLRGASPGQVSIFLDGMPLTSAAHGVVSLGDLPSSVLDRVDDLWRTLLR